MPWFSAEQKAQIDHVFAFYDHEKNGTVPVQSIGEVLRSIGVPVPDGQLKEKVKILMANGKRTVDKSIVEEMAIEFMEYKKSEKALVEAFKRIATDGGKSGKITPSRLRTIMKFAGEKFSDDLIESMIKDTAEQTDSFGMIDYGAISKKLSK